MQTDKCHDDVDVVGSDVGEERQNVVDDRHLVYQSEHRLLRLPVVMTFILSTIMMIAILSISDNDNDSHLVETVRTPSRLVPVVMITNTGRTLLPVC